MKRAMLAATMLAACSAPKGETVLRLGHDQTDGHPYDLAAERFASGVEEATADAVRGSIFPAAQLGDSPEHLEGLHLGSLDLSLPRRLHEASSAA